MLTQAELKSRLHYNPETGIFTRIIATSNVHIGDIAGTVKWNGYIGISIDSKIYYSHRLAWLYMTGSWPKDMIDHINMVKADNRFANLREADNSKNKINQPLLKSNTSGYKGVSFNKLINKFTAQIKINGKKKHLGCFDDPKLASIAFQSAAKKHHGDFYNGN